MMKNGSPQNNDSLDSKELLQKQEFQQDAGSPEDADSPETLERIFKDIYPSSNLLERQYKLIQASRQNKNYTAAEFSRLFEAYCRKENPSEHEIPETLKVDFNNILKCKDLLERQRKLIEASHRQIIYSSEEYFRLFDTYCQKKIRQRLARTVTGFIGILSSVAIFTGVLTFVMESAGREQQLRASAWQVIISNDKIRANAGRKEALEYLNKPSFRRDLINFFTPFSTPFFVINKAPDDRAYLSGLEAPNAFISLVNLEDARLQGANFQKANLFGAKFSRATLSFSNLSQAQLTKAEFIGAKLEKANLSGAVLEDASVKNACFRRANLRGTHLKNSERTSGKRDPLPLDLSGTLFEGAIYDLETNIQGITEDKNNPRKQEGKGMLLIAGERSNLKEKDLREADLQKANLKGADLRKADLEGADLEGADLEGAGLDGTNLYKVGHLTKEQVLKAKNWKQAIYSVDFSKDLEAESGVTLQPGKVTKITQVPGCSK